MPVQLDLLDRDRAADSRAIWPRLPTSARKEIIELFAALVVATVRPSPTTEEAASEPRED
jgi:hypothetical protein